MAVTYTNFRGDTYYFHKGKTKKGTPQYFFPKKREGALVVSIPEGYEIHENPNGRIILRRITAKQVTVQEISIVEKGIKKFSDVEHFKIDVKGKRITVFLPDQEIDPLVDHLSALPFFKQPRLKEELKKVLTYSPMMRFVLDDEKNRKFVVERMCFIDPEGWIFLRGSDDLAKLVKKYSPHLGKDTFFELM